MSDCVPLFLLKSDRAGEGRAEPKCALTCTLYTRNRKYLAKPRRREAFADDSRRGRGNTNSAIVEAREFSAHQRSPPRHSRLPGEMRLVPPDEHGYAADTSLKTIRGDFGEDNAPLNFKCHRRKLRLAISFSFLFFFRAGRIKPKLYYSIL